MLSAVLPPTATTQRAEEEPIIRESGGEGLLACVMRRVTLVILRLARPGFGRLMAGQGIQRQRLALSGYQVLPLRGVRRLDKPFCLSHTTDTTLQSNM